MYSAMLMPRSTALRLASACCSGSRSICVRMMLRHNSTQGSATNRLIAVTEVDIRRAHLNRRLLPLVSYGHRGHGRKMLGHLGSPGCL